MFFFVFSKNLYFSKKRRIVQWFRIISFILINQHEITANVLIAVISFLHAQFCSVCAKKYYSAFKKHLRNGCVCVCVFVAVSLYFTVILLHACAH